MPLYLFAPLRLSYGAYYSCKSRSNVVWWLMKVLTVLVRCKGHYAGYLDTFLYQSGHRASYYHVPSGLSRHKYQTFSSTMTKFGRFAVNVLIDLGIALLTTREMFWMQHTVSGLMPYTKGMKITVVEKLKRFSLYRMSRLVILNDLQTCRMWQTSSSPTALCNNCYPVNHTATPASRDSRRF